MKSSHPKWHRAKMRNCAMAWRKSGGMNNLAMAQYWREGKKWPDVNWRQRILMAKGFKQ